MSQPTEQTAVIQQQSVQKEQKPKRDEVKLIFFESQYRLKTNVSSKIKI